MFVQKNRVIAKRLFTKKLRKHKGFFVFSPNFHSLLNNLQNKLRVFLPLIQTTKNGCSHVLFCCMNQENNSYLIVVKIWPGSLFLRKQFMVVLTAKKCNTIGTTTTLCHHLTTKKVRRCWPIAKNLRTKTINVKKFVD